MKKMRPAVLSRIGRPLTYTRAVPVAAYMGAPFNAKGQLMTPGGFLKAMEQYLYGAWDEESRKQAYAYDYEPLMVTLEYLEQEVEALNMCVLLPTSTQEVDESHFCAPLESISVLVIVNKKILEVRGSGAAPVPNRLGAGITATDVAYKGQFQRLLSAPALSHSEWPAQFTAQFNQVFASYIEAVNGGEFEIGRSGAPLKKLLAESTTRNIEMPDGGDDFILQHKLSPKAGGGGGGGKKARRLAPRRRARPAARGRSLFHTAPDPRAAAT